VKERPIYVISVNIFAHDHVMIIFYYTFTFTSKVPLW